MDKATVVDAEGFLCCGKCLRSAYVSELCEYAECPLRLPTAPQMPESASQGSVPEPAASHSADAVAQSGCLVTDISSRVCERGTKSCVIHRTETATAEGTLGSVNQAGSTPAPAGAALDLYTSLLDRAEKAESERDACLAELAAISTALGTIEGHSSVKHIGVLIAERNELRR